MSQARATDRKRGNRIGFWFFRTAVRVSGLAGAYGLLYLVGLYYLAFDRPAVRASLAYVNRRFPGHGRLRRLLDVYLLFVSQGKSLLDRYYVIAGGTSIEIDIQGLERLKGLLSGEKGLVLLTAHVGNWQVAMTVLRRLGKTVHLLMRPEDNAAVRESLGIDRDQSAIRILHTDDTLGGVVEAMKAISRGELVSIMGDRTYGYSSQEAMLLGGPVSFPYGAFTIAGAAQCPVVVLLSAKVGRRKYLTDVTHVIEPPRGRAREKQEQIRACVQEYARVLEDYADRYPYQWFVFRDMWRSNE
ncbi:MAG TPA: lysophospholipid acyltransferase family protein [Nitrospirota bacterium]|nr:lysophospholipid acyltransferase family protein [Nitrospirota bacterium]